MCACIEGELIHYSAARARPVHHLHALADRVLHAERYRFEFPALVVGQYPFSWAQSAAGRECSAIFIAKYQACYFVLLHELTHIFGFNTHTPAFVLRKIDLLVKYAKCSREKLTISAGLFGVL